MAETPIPPPDMRVSDAQRDHTVGLLSRAYEWGCLTRAEHHQRVEAVRTARRAHDLALLTRDLPDSGAGGAGADAASTTPDNTASGTERITAVLASAEYTGRWLVEPSTSATAVLGTVRLDLREAVLAQRDVAIRCVAVLGRVELLVPPGTTIVHRLAGGTAASRTLGDQADPPAAAPTVTLTGFHLLGRVTARHVSGMTRDSFSDLAGTR
ncbi:uncharacterized protein DUF1707 [Haloactinospora alba]|uniref:Uncharacterized protein DUF1707 n=1 Tax=Haloactinospora alba TaxID=405555 RepID=A0A543NA65_9ACTN|nr:DUF1707 domain-containing protein [Haloactinospora alba]TQN28727.1 uncharacterized protein DUF1707 [Haloactinospora alba]